MPTKYTKTTLPTPENANVQAGLQPGAGQRQYGCRLLLGGLGIGSCATAPACLSPTWLGWHCGSVRLGSISVMGQELTVRTHADQGGTCTDAGSYLLAVLPPIHSCECPLLTLIVRKFCYKLHETNWLMRVQRTACEAAMPLTTLSQVLSFWQTTSMCMCNKVLQHSAA